VPIRGDRYAATRDQPAPAINPDERSGLSPRPPNCAVPEVLHVDGDYDLIAEVTGQPMRRLLDPGPRNNADEQATPAAALVRASHSELG
jgi:hypothetical protein